MEDLPIHILRSSWNTTEVNTPAKLKKQVLPLNAIGRGTTAPTPGTSMGTHGDMMGNHPADKPIRAGYRPIIRWLLQMLMENLPMHILCRSWNTMEANTPAKLKNKYCP